MTVIENLKSYLANLFNLRTRYEHFFSNLYQVKKKLVNRPTPVLQM